MDYCLEVTRKHLLFDIEFHNILLEQMEAESDLIINSSQVLTVLREEAENVAASSEKKEGLWEKIKRFFSELFGTFKDKANSLFKANSQWLEDNVNKFEKVDYKDIKIELLPYWEFDIKQIKAKVPNIDTMVNNILGKADALEKYKDLDTCKKELFKNFLDENDDLTNGLKNYFMVGNSKGPLKAVALEGNGLKEKVASFIFYCQNYLKTIVPNLEAIRADKEKEIQRVEQAISRKKVVKDSFCLVENCFYSETELATYENFVILEAEQAAPTAEEKKKDAPKSENAKDDGHKPTEVNVVNKKNATEKEEDDAKTHYDKYTSEQLQFANNMLKISQIIVAATMTAAENRYKAYISSLKLIIQEASKNQDLKSNATKEVEDDIKKKRDDQYKSNPPEVKGKSETKEESKKGEGMISKAKEKIKSIWKK